MSVFLLAVEMALSAAVIPATFVFVHRYRVPVEALSAGCGAGLAGLMLGASQLFPRVAPLGYDLLLVGGAMQGVAAVVLGVRAALLLKGKPLERRVGAPE